MFGLGIFEIVILAVVGLGLLGALLIPVVMSSRSGEKQQGPADEE